MINLTEADIGKNFKTRGGDVVTLVRYNERNAFPFVSHEAAEYTENGYLWLHSESDHDLIERIEDQQPASSKQENTVTIEPQKSGFLVNGHAFTGLNEVLNWIDDFYQSEQDQDDWIDWHGGECPVDDDTEVDVEYRDGEAESCFASTFSWDHNHGAYNIKKYRVVSN